MTETWGTASELVGAMSVSAHPDFDHLSPSQLRTFYMCGLRYWYERVDPHRSQDERPISGPMLRGKSLDDAATEHFKQKAEDGVGLSKARFIEITVAAHDAALDTTRMDTDEHTSSERMAKQAKVYYDEYASRFVPRSAEDVQRKFRFEHPEIAIPVEGIVDLIDASPMIIDTKVKKTVPKQLFVDEDVQLTTYAMFTGITDVALAIVTDTNSPKAVFMVSKRSKGQIEALALRYQMAYTAITRGVYNPVGEGSWHCNQKWCPFFAQCPLGQNAVAPVAVNIEDWGK